MTTANKAPAISSRSKFDYPLQTLTPTPLFYTLGMELIKTRDLKSWNVNLRRELGDWRGIPGEPFWEYEDENEVEDKDENESDDEWVAIDFAESLVHLFPEGELTQWLPRLTGKFFDGMYTLQIVVRRNCWRRIRLSSHATLYDLHTVIQQAFDFDDDHLYAFFMDGEKWSTKRAFYSPDDDDGPAVTEAYLGELDLSLGQTFVYVFDYGAEWVFNITVENSEPTDTLQLQPQVIESNGAAPRQYRDYD
ncbi:MAG: plasmid pRiA4b ORF-3 family protein [Paenibacillaceae bacterium]|nr:plasmid pRiA4b ORF-3 family protein [Paenibacillaceae bacterium]